MNIECFDVPGSVLPNVVSGTCVVVIGSVSPEVVLGSSEMGIGSVDSEMIVQNTKAYIQIRDLEVSNFQYLFMYHRDIYLRTQHQEQSNSQQKSTQ